MKRGLNFTDINTLKLGLQSGWSIEEITRQTSTSPGVVQKYLDSMDPEEVETLRNQAPADGVDLALLKYELKQEILAEMRGEALNSVEEEEEFDVPETAESPEATVDEEPAQDPDEEPEPEPETEQPPAAGGRKRRRKSAA